ncbi:hypothetical protein DPEC_G00297580 [Dallia pectoralis]|uniref:Uncharacterized protein n=1 Tax=Dallia pectoralis TaxID=75939 RepID=A0ACC2FFQ5_DALPE|nr:hypothetical protein DPEC_G00297580 [Dallia pectoralis]
MSENGIEMTDLGSVQTVSSSGKDQAPVDTIDRLPNNNNTEGASLLNSQDQQPNGSDTNQDNIDVPKEVPNKEVSKVKLWRLIIFIVVVLIVVVIGASIALCSVIHRDTDDTYDSSLFVQTLNFTGSFRLTNQVFTQTLLSPASRHSMDLSRQLEEKLTELYRSSPALGRYFSSAEITSFRNGSVIADFRLHFRLPQGVAELESYTLSREMVFNVFRQFVYDQAPKENPLLNIDPSSLDMRVAVGSGDSE